MDDVDISCKGIAHNITSCTNILNLNLQFNENSFTNSFTFNNLTARFVVLCRNRPIICLTLQFLKPKSPDNSRYSTSITDNVILQAKHD